MMLVNDVLVRKLLHKRQASSVNKDTDYLGLGEIDSWSRRESYVKRLGYATSERSQNTTVNESGIIESHDTSIMTEKLEVKTPVAFDR